MEMGEATLPCEQIASISETPMVEFFKSHAKALEGLENGSFYFPVLVGSLVC